MDLEDKRTVDFLESNLLKEIPFISHLFSTRKNGWSFSNKELNLGLHVGDNKEAVLKNREKLCKELSIDPETLVSGEQVHGILIHKVIKKRHWQRKSFLLSHLLRALMA